MNKKIFLELFEESLDKKENTVQMEDKFRDYEEWDSLAFLSTGAMINEEYDIIIPTEEFEELLTIEDIYNYIQNLKRG